MARAQFLSSYFFTAHCYCILESPFDKNIIIFLLLGTLVTFLLVVAIIFFVFKYHNKLLLQEKRLIEEKVRHQEALITATLQAEEKERQRIAKNVHDEMGTYSSLLKMNLSRLTLLPNQDEHIQNLLTEQKTLITSLASFVRDVSRELASPTVQDFGLYAGLEELFAVLEKNTPIHMALNYSDGHKRFDTNAEIQLLRIIKELLNNLIKHALPKEIVLDCLLQNQNMSVMLTHDGLGISEESYEELVKSSEGFGLKSIAARVQSLNGTIVYKKSNAHYLIQLEIPIRHE